jgi:flavin-dependent dehydrogenase
VPHRVAVNVLLVGDACGCVDALAGEGISAAVAQGAALVPCLRTGRTEDYEHTWREVTRTSRILTAGMLWAGHTPALAAGIVPVAARLPRAFTSLVNHIADA